MRRPLERVGDSATSIRATILGNGPGKQKMTKSKGLKNSGHSSGIGEVSRIKSETGAIGRVEVRSRPSHVPRSREPQCS